MPTDFEPRQNIKKTFVPMRIVRYDTERPGVITSPKPVKPYQVMRAKKGISYFYCAEPG